jgi:hypothetical protein
VGPLARAGALVAVILASGCGSDGSAPSQPRYDLTITYWPAGRGGEMRSATLTCDPDGGSHPDPVAACKALTEHADALALVPTDVACTQIFGGPELARVSGSGVHALFSRRDGCQIARWEALAPLLELSD